MTDAKCVSFIIIYIFVNKISATEVTATDWESRFAALEKRVLAQDVRISELEKEIVTLKQGCPDLPNDKTQNKVVKEHTDDPLKGLWLKQTSEDKDKAPKRAHSILMLGDEAIPVSPRLLAGNIPVVAFEASIAEVERQHCDHVDIEKNGEEMAGGIATNHDGSHHQASVTALLNLVAGDEVYVSIERRDGMTIYGDKLTSFMGILLYAL